MDSPLSPSEWCKQKQTECLERGDIDSAMHYFEMGEVWKGQGR
ncbi:hypothetical protein PEA_00480 [Erwinia phage phiEa1H]|uniref:Uncharacterized protein n=1 Tax=Erwinia phage phiEa100 TaxID=925983 RepID=E5AGL0_9CAUD|nr:hypothetical protein G172_gp50 [Erwinia phage phiEa100]CBX44509.1 hypothetical protein PEA_00480 [Erwinia phage phiEa1H]CBX45112.1 hypothetical protein P100_00490 [Erwinia phage phiEa100]